MLLGLELQPHENLSVEVLYHAMLEQGFLVGIYPAGNILRFDPALTIEKESLDLFQKNLDLVLDKEVVS